MVYLSKGIARENSTGRFLQIVRGGQTFQLTGNGAALWRDGQFGFAVTRGAKQDRALRHLSEMGLVESDFEDTGITRYRIMTGCICCPAEIQEAGEPVSGMEERILFWLKDAGIRLSVAELVYLQENRIKPEPGLMYPENSQALIEFIYLQNPVMDNLLENQMEAAACRDEVVGALVELLKKKKIMVL